MNVNLHIDSIVLDGVELGQEQGVLLQQTVCSKLVKSLMEHGVGPSFGDSCDREMIRGHAIQLGSRVDVATVGPQLAGSIYAGVTQSALNPRVLGGQK